MTVEICLEALSHRQASNPLYVSFTPRFERVWVFHDLSESTDRPPGLILWMRGLDDEEEVSD